MSPLFVLCPLLYLLYLPLSLVKGREGDTSRTNWRFFSQRSHCRLGEICRRRRCLREGVGRYKKARRAAAGYVCLFRVALLVTVRDEVVRSGAAVHLGHHLGSLL